MKSVAFVLAAMAVSGPALAQSQVRQFDLLCSGTVLRVQPVNGGGGAVNRTTSPFTQRLRFDLTRTLFCEGDCSSPTRMFAVTDTELILGIGNPVTGRIDRMSGAYKRQYSGDNFATAWYEGVCTPAAYSGIPAARF